MFFFLGKTIVEKLQLWYQQDKKNGLQHLITYNGRPVQSVKKSWKKAKQRAKITRRIRMYDIRHAFITTLLSRGAPIKAVSELAGHASPDMTLRVYQHVSSQLKRETIDLLND